MKHAILGAGAIGGLMATALAAIGEEVFILVRQEKLAGYPQTLVLERPSGNLSGTVKAVSTLSEPADVLWIATKTYQLEAALDTIVAAPSIIIPLLNGIDHVAVLRTRFGRDQVVPGTIAVEAERVAPGHFVQRSPVRLNVAAAGEAALAGSIERLKELGFLCQFVNNEQTLLWGKLCFLGPFALVTTASGKNLGEILADPEWKAQLDTALAEARTVATASGAEIDAAKIQAAIENSPASMRSSMAKDLVAGRRLELEGIAGPIMAGGARYGIAVPTTRELVRKINLLASRQQR